MKLGPVYEGSLALPLLQPGLYTSGNGSHCQEASHPFPAIMEQDARTFSLRRTRPWQPVPSADNLRSPPTPSPDSISPSAPRHSGQQDGALPQVSNQHTGPSPDTTQAPPQLRAPLNHESPPSPPAWGGRSLIWHTLPTRLPSVHYHIFYW